MAKRKTKEIILFKALKLFADNGYDGVTVRDIASEVGIMQSSLYKHYKSKQEIFDTLVQTMQTQFKEASATFHLPEGTFDEMANEYANGGNAALKTMSSSIFHYYLKDPHASQFRKMLSIERYKDKEIDRIYREIFMDSAISYQTTLFKEMIEQGFMRKANPEIMAVHFFSPIFVLLNAYDCVPEKENEAIELLEKHIDQFDMMYRKK